MVKDILKTKQKKGFGFIVLLSLLLFPPLPLIGSIILIKRIFRPKLNITPHILISRKKQENIVFWGFLIIAVGLLITWIDTQSPGVSDIGISMFVMLPILLNGIFILIYNAVYNDRLLAADELLLQTLKGKETFFTNGFSFTTSKNRPIGYGEEAFKRLLEDMKENEIIDFIKDGPCYRVTSLTQTTHIKEMLNINKAEVSWMCKSCGASNNSATTCEYCGGRR